MPHPEGGPSTPARDTSESTSPHLSRRQVLRGAGVGVGILAAGAPLSARVLRGGDRTSRGSLERAETLRGTLRGRRRVGASVVAAGDTLRFDPSHDTTLEVSGNLIVRGRLVMKPNRGVRHVLRFVDVDEDAFVGGGLDPIGSDVGLWVMGRGQLDVRGTPKQAWNRQGKHRTWSRRDDLVVAPVQRGDFTARRFRRGSHVPRAGSHRAEVLNLTRNVRIEGTPGGRAHIFIRSRRPQSIRYALLRYLGPRQGGGGSSESVLGRYGLHFHHCHGGSRNSVVEGVVVRDCGGHAFVPHMSHGITFRSCISYETFEAAYWWDEHDTSNDVLFDRCVAAGVHADPEIHGYRLAGFSLGKGRRLRIRDCVAFGVIGNNPSAGYVWPEAPSGLWAFRDNVAHNNAVAGIFVWQNVREPHVIRRFTAYRNGEAGIIHGAYLNAYHYKDVDLRDQANAIELHAAGRPDYRGNQQSWVDVRAGRLWVVGHQLPGEGPVLFRDCSFTGGVVVDDGQQEPADLDFVNCGLAHTDFDVGSMHASTTIRVQRPNRTAFRITSGGVDDIAPFYPY